MMRRIAGTVIHSASSFQACSNIHRQTSSCFFCSSASNSNNNNNIHNAASASAKKNVPVKERPRLLGRPHPRNSFQGTYDMERLTSCYPALGPHVIPGPTGRPTVNWSDPAAVKALNTAVLVADYGVSPRYADILPVGTLCPPVPGRADYVHTIADVLQKSMLDDNDNDDDNDDADTNNNDCTVPIGTNIVGLDIGTGASCIYPTIAASIYGWRMIGSDSNTASIASARDIVKANGHDMLIDVCTQQHSTSVFAGVLDSKEVLDFVMCNPPFYSSREAFQAENARKLKGLSKKKKKKKRGRNNTNNNTGMPITTKVEVNSTTTSNNFGGTDSELWCEGGEVAFVKNMILESERYWDQCLFFTSLVSRQENLKMMNPTQIINNVEREHTRKDENNSIRRIRRRVEIQTVIPLAVGRKTSNILLWSFLGKEKRRQWARKRNWKTISFASP